MNILAVQYNKVIFRCFYKTNICQQEPANEYLRRY